VRGHRDRETAVLVVAHDVQHLANQFWVQRRGDLIEQQQVGLRGQRADDRGATGPALGTVSRTRAGTSQPAHQLPPRRRPSRQDPRRRADTRRENHRRRRYAHRCTARARGQGSIRVRGCSAYRGARHPQSGEPRRAVASLTLLTAAQVRAIERATPSPAKTRHRPARVGAQHDDHDTHQRKQHIEQSWWDEAAPRTTQQYSAEPRVKTGREHPARFRSGGRALATRSLTATSRKKMSIMRSKVKEHGAELGR
jgi:hypothetical protein